MTQNTREKTLTAAFVAAITLAVASLFLVLLLISQGVPSSSWSHLRQHTWWFEYPIGQLTSSAFLFQWGVLIVITSFVVVFIVRLRTIFSRSASAEAYFFVFFLFSVGVEGLRMAIPQLESIHTSIPLVLLITKTVYAGRFFGSICLFVATLYGLSIEYPRLGTVLIVSMLLTAIYAYTLVIDSSVQITTFLYRLGDEKGTAIIFWALGLVTIVNPLIAAAVQRDRSHLFFAAGLTGVLIGRDIVIFNCPPPLTVAGSILFLAACAVCVRTLRSKYDRIY